MLAIAVPVPEVGHAVIDDIAAARTAKQVADGEAMHHAGRSMDAAHGVVWLQRRAFGIEIEEAAGRVEDTILEEIEKSLGLFYQPLAMPGQGVPVAAVVIVLGHSRPPCGLLLRLISLLYKPVICQRYFVTCCNCAKPCLSLEDILT